MREITFIKLNIAKWEQSPSIAEDADSVTPDRLAEVYTDISADLAFAQTHYPDSRITKYLNGLASSLHNTIYSNKREKRSRLITFWTHEVPLVMYEARWLLLASLLIFLAGDLIGIISQYADIDFARVIMGNGYIDMTEANIAAGKPMNVYASADGSMMYYQIAFNNIKVAFTAFASGLFTSIASGFIMFHNGVMMGCFDAYCAQKGFLGLALVTTNLHGTLEISAIIVAGAGGLAMGNSWLFPGTYPRMTSFIRGARRGLKIVLGAVPTLAFAAIIESYVTRYVDMPLWIKLTIIILSAIFIIFYYIVWPQVLARKEMKKGNMIKP